VVDEGSQVVLAAEVTQQATDIDQLLIMIGVTEGNLDAADIDDSPEVILADAGYCSEANLQQIADAEINTLVATGRIRGKERVSDAPRGRIPNNATQRERMARRLRTKPGRADYARRKAIVEPAFGQMKVRQAAGHLRLRGLAGAQGEWTLHVICHNLRKLANANGVTLGPAKAHHGSFGPEIDHGQGTLQSLGRMVPTECHRRCRISGVGHRHPAGPF
jgi:hypothetical protein